MLHEAIVFVYNFQTLIAGLFALLGAILTVGKIRAQINEAVKQEEERRQRRNFAARAMMPIALSAMIDYSKTCVKILRPLLPESPEQRVKKEAIDKIPSIPDSAIETLRDCIEFGDDPIPGKLAHLLKSLQIQHSRLANAKNWLSTSGKIVVKSNIIQYIIDSLEIIAAASNLIPYARREIEVPADLEQAHLMTAAQICDIWDDTEIFAGIKRRYG